MLQLLLLEVVVAVVAGQGLFGLCSPWRKE